MNKWIFSAGVLSLFTCVVHVFGGGPEVHVPVLNSTLSIELKAIISVLWHWTTAVLIINGVALIWAAKRAEQQKVVTILVGMQYVAFAGMFMFYSLYLLGSAMSMPQWTLFLAIVLVSMIGLKREESVQSLQS